MPRHFLVKRHKHCGASLSYRDTLQETQDSATDDGNFVTTSTTIIDTDKHIIIRDGDHFSDYSGYSSPDSGYAASPNSAQAGFAREKENVGTDRENNNNKNFNKVANGVGFYDSSHHASVKNPHPHHHHHSSSSSGGGRDSHSHSNSINDINREDHYMMVDPPDAPIDLSMPSRKKNVLSSVPAYLQQENHRHHHHHHHHQIKSQQQQQQQQQQHQRQLYHRPPSPVHSATVSAAAAAAAVAYFSSFNNFYLSDKTDRSLCHAVVPPLSPSHPAYNPPLPLPLHLPRQDSRPSGLYPSTIKTDVSLETSAAAAHSEILSRPQCISVPTASSGQKLSSSSSAAPSISSSSSPQPPMVAREQVTAPVPGRLTPLKTPSPLHSPNRKRVISEDHEELSNGCYPHDLSKSAPVLKKSDSSLTAVTPASKGTSSSTQSKAKTAAPAVKKSQSSTPSGKKLRAVRRLNFDIDTTSPVSGTIIKDAADFHPEEGKVVYGDIEPSFNFVEVTPEARAELERIENKIGDYICQLCKEFFEDAFQLAQHRCSRIVHVEYRCPECEKVFNCPANLASHRRWHKPRTNAQTKGNGQGAGKLLSANPKIAPKPDCNGNSMTGTTFSATAATSTSTQALTSTSVTSGRDDCVNDELASVDAGKNGVQTSEPLTSVKSLEGDISANNTKDNEAVSVGPGLQAHPFRNESNSEPHSNEKDSSVIVGGSKSSADEEHTSGDSEFQTYSLSQNDSYLRPSTVIATNPLHTTTFGSTLTAEERSLVLQVLNSHHRQHQTTTITSTTTVMTPLVSDTHCNIMMDPENRPYLTGERAIQNDTADVIRPVQRHDDRVCMDTSVSPLPLDLTNASDQHKQKDLSQQQKFHPQQQQQQQHQIGALSERQGNPQIECSLCGKRFQRQAYLRKHMHSQHNKQNNVIKTADINIDANTKGKTMDNGVNINSDHHATIDTTTTTNCGVCSKGFSSESARLKHEAVIHGLTPHLTCSACGMTFTSKAALDKHTRSAHAAETYACKYCASSFHSSPGLTRHINKCHPTENRQVILLQLPASRTC